jgi:regulator of sigma D
VRGIAIKPEHSSLMSRNRKTFDYSTIRLFDYLHTGLFDYSTIRLFDYSIIRLFDYSHGIADISDRI